MDELFRKFCYYYISKDEAISLEELKEKNPKDFKKYQKKSQKYVKNLVKKAKSLGYGVDFESFCSLLENYINKKDEMNDEEKKDYLRLLLSLSKIHEVNLREELERYTSPKKKTSKIDKNTIFKSFCLYNLQENSKVEDFNNLKDLAKKANLDFNTLQQKSIIFVEEIKKITKKLGFSPQKEDLYKMIDKYTQEKKYMTDKEKTNYLKILLYLSELYSIDLRAILKTQKENPELKETLDISSFSNPLDKEELLSSMITQRYQEGSFDIKNLTLEEDKIIKNNDDFNYQKLQASLTYKLFSIFLDKFNNYAYDDLNHSFTSLIGEEELSILSNIDEDTIYNLIKEINNHESSHYIIKKYKLTNNLYQFIYLAINNTTDFRTNNIGIGDNSLFNNDNTNPTISIYINGPKYETIIILIEYIKQCIINNLNYNMIGLDNDNKTILYATTKDLLLKLNILNKIADNNPQIIEELGNPLSISSTINHSFYGISVIGLLDLNNENYIPYIDYINDLSEVAYYRTLAKLVINKVPEEKAKIILEKFIALNNISISFTRNPKENKYNNISFDIIKDIVNQYIPSVANTLSIYINDPSKKDILIKEFKKSLQYLSNIIIGKDKKEDSNIALNLIS